jgi:hypothetical protein
VRIVVKPVHVHELGTGRHKAGTHDELDESI